MIRLSHVTCLQAGEPAVEDITGAFGPGLSAVAGSNGAGKSTLLRALAGLHPVASGAITLEGLRQADIALLPQAGGLDRQFPITVGDLVALGAWRRVGSFRRVALTEVTRSQAALERVGLAGMEQRLISALSAGQFQRVLFARLIVQDTRAILLDEPFNAVDARTQADLMTLIRAWGAEGRIVVVVLHDDALIRAEFANALLLRRRVLSWGPASTLPVQRAAA